MTARVRAVTRCSKSSGSMRWSAWLSTSTGVAPTATTAEAVATNVCDGSNTSSPASTPAARRPSSSPSVALPTPTAKPTPQ